MKLLTFQLLLLPPLVAAFPRLYQYQEEKDEHLYHDPHGVTTHPNGIVTMATKGLFTQGENAVCKRFFDLDEESGLDERYEDNENGAHSMRLQSCNVNAWFEWNIEWKDGRNPDDEFPYWSPKRYSVAIRFQTNHPQQDLVLELRHKEYQAQHWLMRVNVTIPAEKGDGQWHLTDPVQLPIDIGGDEEFVLRVTFPTHRDNLNGKFWIRDFDFVPTNAFDEGQYSINWFLEWQDRVLEHVKQQYVPQVDLTRPEFAAYNDTIDAFEALLKEENAGNEKQYREPMNNAYGAILESLLPVLEGVVDPALKAVDHTDPQWLQAVIFQHATPLKLADYCHDHAPQACTNLVNFLLTDTELMYNFLKYGGPKNGFYGQALDIYNTIKMAMVPGNEVLDRLALAVALELAEPTLHHRWQPEYLINPIERYKHYEQAYLGGELDPYFEVLSVWELRWVVNEDVPDRQLTWARNMLRTYRPDFVTFDEHNWRYNRIMTTDVYYRLPVWTSLPEGNHMQTLSNGGRCGPRAKFARFVSRAFGVPVWGVTVPGHATYHKWHPNGWTMAFGKRWWYGWWEDRDGFDFMYEAYIRRQFGPDYYFQEVEALHWMAKMMGEYQFSNNLPKKQNPWIGLSLMQRFRVYKRIDRLTPAELPDHNATAMEHQHHITTIVQEMMDQPLLQYEPIYQEEVKRKDTTVIPAMAWSAENGGAEFMKSYGGGMQLLLKEDGEVVYHLNSTEFGLEARTYKFEINMASVHVKDPVPFKLVVSSDAAGAQEPGVYEVPFKYTYGLWQYSDGVEIELGGGLETLELSRSLDTPSLESTGNATDVEIAAVAIKNFRLTPA